MKVEEDHIPVRTRFEAKRVEEVGIKLRRLNRMRRRGRARGERLHLKQQTN